MLFQAELPYAKRDIAIGRKYRKTHCLNNRTLWYDFNVDIYTPESQRSFRTQQYG